MPLVDYGSSSEEEEEEVFSLDKKMELKEQSITKRTIQDDSERVPPKRIKIALPPLPNSLTDLFRDRERPADNPERHQGRTRTRAHIDGSWPVHVYLEVKLSSELFDIVTTLIKVARKSAPGTVSLLESIASKNSKNTTPIEAEASEDATELHISLTKPLYLQELHTGRFASDVRDAFKKRKKFSVSFSGVQSFANEDKTRSFLSLRVGSGHAEIESLVSEMDMIVERYCQPAFYEDPQFHASFAWALGGNVLNEDIVDTMTELEGELGHDLRHCSITVRRVAWKIGQKVGSVALS